MENTTFQAKLRSDKRKNPELRTYRYMTFAEVKSSNHKHLLCLDKYGDVATVHVTSIKTWKTRQEIEIHYQFGLYEHLSCTMFPNGIQGGREVVGEFVVEVTGDN